MSYAIRKDGMGWRAVNGSSDVGHDETYSSTQPETLLPMIRATVFETLPKWEQVERAAGIEHAGHRWLTTPSALQDIRDVLLAGAVPAEQWVTADRQVVPMTLPELQALWQAITARGASIYRRRLQLEADIAAMDAGQLAAFVPGWGVV